MKMKVIWNNKAKPLRDYEVESFINSLFSNKIREIEICQELVLAGIRAKYKQNPKTFETIVFLCNERRCIIYKNGRMSYFPNVLNTLDRFLSILLDVI